MEISLDTLLLKLDPRFIKFLAVGLLNTLFGYGTYALLVFLGLHYFVATLVSTIVGVLFNFKTTGSLVFKIKKNSQIIQFIAVYAVLYVINIAGLALLSRLGLSTYYCGALMLLPMAVFAFILNKRFVFRNV